MRLELLFLLLMPLVRAQTANTERSTSEPEVDWTPMIPALRNILQHKSAYIRAHGDVTGDGVPVVLARSGNGAYTTYFTVLRLKNGRPVEAIFRQPDGKMGSGTFLEGSSVKHGEAVRLRPEFHAIFAAHYTMDDGEIETCNGEAYKWNIRTEIFDYDKRLSKRISTEFCRDLALTLHGPQQPQNH